MKIVIIGGGAAGFFSALAAKEFNRKCEVQILERSAKLLSKLRISGGGRCNVTHACFEPRLLVQNYPRGYKELLGPFHKFQPLNTIEWFKSRNIILKKEGDGRMFPSSDSSETIINCFMNESEKLGVKIHTLNQLKTLRRVKSGFELVTRNSPLQFADRVIMATGSAQGGWDIAASLGHTLQTPVPSLFTFNIPEFPLVTLSGVSISSVRIKIKETGFEQTGPLLITHWGFSGPSALKLSAMAARYLFDKKYEVTLMIDWLPSLSTEEFHQLINTHRQSHPRMLLGNLRISTLPKSLWKKLCIRSGLTVDLPLNTLSNSSLSLLSDTVKRDHYKVSGKTTNKEEFVTCGGVTLSEINFKTMQSKCCNDLFFCGEVLDIDGVTGGFNFQCAWTTGWIAGRAAAS